jgi:hypothetical protein
MRSPSPRTLSASEPWRNIAVKTFYVPIGIRSDEKAGPRSTAEPMRISLTWAALSPGAASSSRAAMAATCGAAADVPQNGLPK